MALLQTSQITGSGDLLLPGGEINDTGTDLNIVGTNAVTLQTSAGTAISIPGGSLNTTIYGSAQIRGGLLELGEHGVAGGSLVSDGDMVYNSAYNDASGNNGDHIFKTFSGGTEVARFKYDKSAVFAGDVTINGGNDCLIVTGLNATMKLVAASNDWTRIKFHPDNASSSKQWLIGAHKDSPYQFLFQNALGTTLSLDGNAHNATFAGKVEMDAGSFVDNAVHKGYKVTNGSDGNGYLWAKYMHVANGAGATKLCQAYDYQAFLVSVTHDGGNGSALDYVWIDSANGAPTVNNIVESGTVPTRTYTRGDGWAMTYITLGDSGLGAHKVQCMKLGGY